MLVWNRDRQTTSFATYVQSGMRIVMPQYRRGHIADAELVDLLTIVIDQDVFPDEGELQTVCGYYRRELLSIKAICNRMDVATIFDPEKMRHQMANLLMGYPHNMDRLIDERYGYDVSWRD